MTPEQIDRLVGLVIIIVVGLAALAFVTFVAFALVLGTAELITLLGGGG